MKVSLYTPEALDEIVGLATQNQTEAEWMAKALSNIAALVQKNPLEYRTFGVFWWPVKSMLIDAKLLYGAKDAEYEVSCSAGSKARDLAGALAYHEHCTRNFMNSNYLTVTDDEGSMTEFVLADDELEMLASLRRM